MLFAPRLILLGLEKYVISFATKEGRKKFHVQWLQPGCHTILQESAHSRSLFLIEECDDLDLQVIYSKCNLMWLSAGEDESTFVPNDSNGENDFFAQFVICILFLDEVTTLT